MTLRHLYQYVGIDQQKIKDTEIHIAFYYLKKYIFKKQFEKVFKHNLGNNNYLSVN